MATATATVLFCDVVESTKHRARLGEVEADRFFPDLERRLRDLVASRNGRVVRGGGDGVMAVFDAASDAVAAAIALQRGASSGPFRVQLRVGVAAGDVTWEDDDCFGMSVVVAARLEAASRPGGILVSSVVRHLAGDRADADYEPVGSLDLKGVPEPVEAFSVPWTIDETAASTWSFPSTLPGAAGRPFVGRAEELTALRRAWVMVSDGGSGSFLVGGEAGAGKTRLITEFARSVHTGGAIVLGGLCDRELSLPYQPWVMILDDLIRQLPAEELEAGRADLADLQVLVPGIERRLPGLPSPESLDPEAERHRLFSAVASLLATAAALAPVLLIVDDLHWAGNQTLDLFRFLARTMPVDRCLIVSAFRDTGDEIADPLASLLAELRRTERVTRIKMGGIDHEAVYELLASVSATGDLRARASEIVERTAGNAFLVSELSLHGGEGTIPDSVVDVVEARLLRLGPPARRLANLIAVAGRVELPVLVDAASASGSGGAGGDATSELGIGLGELLRAGMVQELSGGVPSYQFSHALIRDAVASALTGFERFSLHRSLAESLERVHERDRRQVLAELARHFSAAAPLAGWEKAAYYGRRAATHARRTAAYEEAIELIRTALEVTPDGTEERALLLVDAVDLLERCGRNPEAVVLAEEADDAAAAQHHLRLQAHASIELERAAHLANASLDRSIHRLERVLEERGRLEPTLACQVAASLGRARWLTGTSGGQELIDEALAEARQLADPATVGHVLEMACVAERDPHRALVLATELEGVTAGLGRIFQSMWAMTRQTDALLTLGRLAEAEQVLERLRASADRYRFTSYRYLAFVFTHTLALAAAAFDIAEEATEAANTAEAAEFAGLDASGAYGLQMFMIRRAQGRLEEMRPVLQLLGRSGTVGVWRSGLVVAHAELGMLEEAADGFDELIVDDCESCPRDTLWPLTLLFLADTCLLLGRADAVPLLLAELEPYRGLTIRAGYTTNGGPADRCRAALLELGGRPVEADEAITAAHRLATASASPLWLASTEETWAWICARRGDAAGVSTHHGLATELAGRHRIGGIGTDPPAGIAPGRVEVVPDVEELPDRLSAREVEVLAELARGRTNRRIAEVLHISPNTAANHVRAILRKTGTRNRTEAAAYALHHGLTGPDPADGCGVGSGRDR